ncbi:MAG: lysine--tRNA ligase [Methanomethylophilus sp.]|jgi:lysyl-tRNA synthetase class 1
MHWADVIAKDIAEKAEHPLIATGISPTGIIHVGSLREAITGESIRSAVEALGKKDVRLIYLIDSFDPLRKRYDFLPPEYEKYVGMPICRIPCPCGKHRNYAHHFVQPFLDAVDSLGVHCEIIWTSDLYAQGKFAEAIDITFKKRQDIIRILHEVSGKEANPDYAPYNPICEKCGRYTKPIFDTYQYPYVEYDCVCGHHGKADIRKDQGKLTWRLEWPAKWMIFGTSAEPFGKDHAAAGGSYDTGKRFAKEIFGIEPPYPIPYEFVQLKGVGQMHKSLGCSVTGIDAIRMTPPEVLNYLFLRVPPHRAIDYDSGMGNLDICDEYDRMERLYFEGGATEAEENAVRAYAIAQHNHIPEKMPVQVSMRHLVNVVQIADGFEEQLKVISRTIDISGATEDDLRRIRTRCDCVKYWLNAFAPDQVKFAVSQTIPANVVLKMNDKAFLQSLVTRMNDCNWDADTIGNIISECGKASPIGLKNAYKVIYSILIGKPAGPRLGSFLASMDKQFVINRFNQAAYRQEPEKA